MSNAEQPEPSEAAKTTRNGPAPVDTSQIEQDEVNVGLLAMVGAVLVVAVVLAVVLLQAWFYAGKANLAAARTLPASGPQMPLGRALVEQQEQINSYHWINREAKIPAIPIRRAMELVAKELAAQGDEARERGEP